MSEEAKENNRKKQNTPESPSIMTASLSTKLNIKSQTISNNSFVNCIYWFRKALRLHGN